jgi:transcriptional regulator with XRE-family HTH domain
MERYVEIGARIKQAREDMEMSQGELAEEVGFKSPTAISLIEAGTRKVAIEDLETIATVLKQPIEYFLGKEQPEITLEYALRSDKKLKNLDATARKSITEFADFVRNQKNGKR